MTIPAIAGDGSLFPIGKLEAHRRGQLHLAISVFLFDGDRLLLQRRARMKYHCGGQWANTCCTHPHWGEDPSAAAHRRVREELGIVAVLEPRGIAEYRAPVTNGLIEHERVSLFAGFADAGSLVIASDPREVEDTAWMTPSEIHAAIAARPDDFTPWFRIYAERYPTLSPDGF